ncbi:PEP-CTERM sorting domain-containing protein [Thalassomonas actiniarum]|uniref:PEP-CTERM sorting domain-containing protein n=1 Tax=Thalassomonas actiniarum TaxID=485447 RepID=A0AAE9YTT4_9GAMM|nr:PEP-CTERM sorting domain-containing protein [Thalassomonas actiniarum]WDE01076.1 PEP-CTERM sorting domain-containing protein [Thalassomonas actiniarum]
MIKALLTTLLLSFTAISHATVITFEDWQYNSGYQIDWRVSIDDESNDGFFTFNIGIGTANPTGDILGFAFDTTADFDIPADLVNYSTYDFSNYTTDSLSCGPGCNFNGATRYNFDNLFKVGDQGSGGDYVTLFSFGLAKGDLILDETLFTRVAIRAQSVGDDCDTNNCNGSVKDISEDPTVQPPVSVPEPSTAMLLGLAILGFSARSRKRQSS